MRDPLVPEVHVRGPRPAAAGQLVAERDPERALGNIARGHQEDGLHVGAGSRAPAWVAGVKGSRAAEELCLAGAGGVERRERLELGISGCIGGSGSTRRHHHPHGQARGTSASVAATNVLRSTDRLDRSVQSCYASEPIGLCSPI